MPENKFEFIFYRVIALLIFVYIVLRAWLLPITVDEATTVINHVPRGVWDMVTYEKSEIPNNHVLNTLGIKLLTGLFGMHYFTARIPAMFGGVLYLFATLALTRRASNSWLRLGTFTLLLANPFLIEFFSLARGYGLAAGLMLMAIWQAVVFLDNGRYGALLWAPVLGALGVEANFTLLNWYIPFAFLLLVLAWQKKDQRFIRLAVPVVLTTIVLAALVYWPIVRMRATDQFQFWGNSGFISETLRPFVESSTRKAAYFGDQTGRILSWSMLLFSCGAWLAAVVRFWRNAGKMDEGLFLSALFAGAICFNMVQFWLFKTPFLNPRTALFFYPLFALQLLTVARWLWAQWSKRALIFLVPVLLLAGINFGRNANLRNCYEWGIDSGTFLVLDYLKTLQKTEQHEAPYTLDTVWMMFNSMQFHVDHHPPHYETVAKLPSWHSGRVYPQDTEFYYTLEDEAKDLLGTYDIVLRIPDEPVVLLRRRAVH